MTVLAFCSGAKHEYDPSRDLCRSQACTSAHNTSGQCINFPEKRSLISLGATSLRRCGGRMKGQEVSGGLRGHSAQQAQAAAASFSSASPPKNGKGESDGVRGHADASAAKAIGWSVFC